MRGGCLLEVATQEHGGVLPPLDTLLTLLIGDHPCMLLTQLLRILCVLHLRETLQTLHTAGQGAIRLGTELLQSLVHLDAILVIGRHSFCGYTSISQKERKSVLNIYVTLHICVQSSYQ